MRKIKIPKSFTLGLKQIDVEFDNDHCNDGDQYGEAVFEDGTIILCDTFKGQSLSKHTIDTTFYHELAHLILHSIGEHKLKYNEKFVDKLGLAIYEYEISKKFK